MHEGHQRDNREKMVILGDLGADSLVPWIERHANKLGLRKTISYVGIDRIEMEIEGPLELINAMEMGCSLGPIDVWVETILRAPSADKNPEILTG